MLDWKEGIQLDKEEKQYISFILETFWQSTLTITLNHFYDF